MNYSEQHLVSCDCTDRDRCGDSNGYDNGSCSGGHCHFSMKYLAETGLVHETEFDYTATEEQCIERTIANRVFYPYMNSSGASY